MRAARLGGGESARMASGASAVREGDGGGSDAVVGRICISGVGLAIAAVVLQSIVDTANEYLVTPSRADLNPGQEGNAFTWASATASYAAGLGALVCAVFEARRRRAAIAAGLILVYFSLDDLLALHEPTDEAVGAGLPQAVEDRLDLLLFAPLFAAFLLALVRLRPVVPSRPRRILEAGVLCLVVSVVFDEIVGEITRRVREGGVAWPDHVRGLFEEGLELGGVLLLATALAAAAVASIVRRAGPRAAEVAAFVGVAFALVVVAIQAPVDLVNSLALDSPVAALDAGGEQNAFAWLEAVVALGAAAFFALLLAIAGVERRLAYLALAATLCVLAADDVVEGLSRVADRLPVEGPEWVDRRAVLAFELPLQLVALTLAWLLAARWPPPARATARFGVLLLALGIVLDQGLLEVSDWLRETDRDGLAALKGTLEEGAEVAGAALLAGALASALIDRLRGLARAPRGRVPPDGSLPAGLPPPRSGV